MFAYDKTFGPKEVLGHCDLISRFSDFASYLVTQMVYDHISFTVYLCMKRHLTLNFDLIPWFIDFCLIS